MAKEENKKESINQELVADQTGEEQVVEEKIESKEEQEDPGEDQKTEDVEDSGNGKEIEKLKAELKEAKDKYLRLYSEFENFRRRTAREKLDMIKTAGEDLIVALLPVMDDFERAQKALEESEDHKASKEGFELIYNKFNNILKQKGLKPMKDKAGADFNTEYHEAISQMPVDKKKMKGKIIDVIEKGYYLDDKVIRFAKVVIGA